MEGIGVQVHLGLTVMQFFYVHFIYLHTKQDVCTYQQPAFHRSSLDVDTGQALLTYVDLTRPLTFLSSLIHLASAKFLVHLTAAAKMNYQPLLIASDTSRCQRGFHPCSAMLVFISSEFSPKS